MYVTRMDLQQLRCFDHVQLQPGPGMNLITGANGAGKTSVIEALHLMGYGRSFRGRVRDGLVRSGADALSVFLEWQELAGTGGSAPTRSRRAGLRHSGHNWTGRLDGVEVQYLGELCAALAVVTFEPGSHALITGSSEIRRRYVDWGLFHVEPAFLGLWRRYSRALKQKNALLKQRTASAQLDSWDSELVSAGESLGRFRRGYLSALEPLFVKIAAELAPSLAASGLSYLPGWREDEVSLADALLLSRERDVHMGFTSVGPHRADWRISFGELSGREALSRGQAKLSALSAVLAQASHFASEKGEWPVVALDDLASELDREHQGRVLRFLDESEAQVFITGTELPGALLDSAHFVTTRFHVEHGEIKPVTGAATD